MRTLLLPFLICHLLVACSGPQTSIPPAFTGKAASELPFRIKSHSYPAYRKGIQYRATALYRYDSQNRLIRIDSTGYGQSIAYQYTDNRLTERQTYLNGKPIRRTRFLYNAKGKLEKSMEQNDGSPLEITYQYLFDDDGQLIEQATTYPSSTGNGRINRYTWQNGNVVAMVERDEKGYKRSEWSYAYDQQPNYRALLPVDPDPDQLRTYNNKIITRLERDYTGLIDLCRNPHGTRYNYQSNGLTVRWEVNSCSLYYNEIEYEAKQ